MVMSTLVGPETAAELRKLREELERVAVDGDLTAADRAYLTSVAVRLEGLARSAQERADARNRPKTEPPTTKVVERHWTRKEAARLLKVHPNTLLNWHRAGLLVPKLDANGWRVYSTADIQRGMAILAHVPPEELP